MKIILFFRRQSNISAELLFLYLLANKIALIVSGPAPRGGAGAMPPQWGCNLVELKREAFNTGNLSEFFKINIYFTILDIILTDIETKFFENKFKNINCCAKCFNFTKLQICRYFRSF